MKDGNTLLSLGRLRSCFNCCIYCRSRFAVCYTSHDVLLQNRKLASLNAQLTVTITGELNSSYYSSNQLYVASTCLIVTKNSGRLIFICSIFDFKWMFTVTFVTWRLWPHTCPQWTPAPSCQNYNFESQFLYTVYVVHYNSTITD